MNRELTTQQLLRQLTSKTRTGEIEWRSGALRWSYLASLASGYVELQTDRIGDGPSFSFKPRKLTVRERTSERVVLSIDLLYDLTYINDLQELTDSVVAQSSRFDSEALAPFLRELA
jgi:hypothetical protein